MSDRLFAVVGDGSFSGNTLTNVGNRTTNYHIYPHHERRILTLESRVSFGALLNSEERYPAPKCYPETRKEAQKTVKNWLCRKGEGSEKGIMWMSGAPGVGKSAIAQTVCEELCGDDGTMSWFSRILYRQRHIDGCFFFMRGFENRENASFFPATIAFQLRRSRPSCCTAIDKAIEKRPEILSEDILSQFRQLLTKAAQATGFLEGPVTVVIDGLDECNSAHDQVTLLGLILEAVKTGNMRFFIASRPEEQIHTFFHRPDVAQHTYHVRLDEETFQTSHDIKAFLRKEFARIRLANPGSCLPLPNGEEWPGERVLDYLTLESDSQFMFPTLAIGFVDTPYFSPERQLKILLEAPPSGAFSALDILYHKILSRQPPAQHLRGEEDLGDYQGVVLGILRVIIAWSGRPLSAAEIAVVLDKPSDVVKRIVRGPMRTLFKFHTSEPDSPITLCHKSLRDYLLARDRSQEFFIPSAEEDDLFVAILSRCPTYHHVHPNMQGIVMDVLSFLCASDPSGAYAAQSSVPEIAEFLDVDSAVVDYVVNIGPSRLLFISRLGLEEEQRGIIYFSTESLQKFLTDPVRSGPFFLWNRRTDALFIQGLSRPQPFGSPRSFSRDIVLDIQATLHRWIGPPPTINDIAAFLELDSRVVEEVIMLGYLKWLVTMDERHKFELINAWVYDFLENGDRSRELFISQRRLDPVLIRILSKASPSESSSRNILMDILMVVLVVGKESTICKIAFLLGLNRNLVEGVVKLAPTNLLFRVNQDNVSFSIPRFASFLEDSDRSGPFFISSSRIDAFLIQFLSRGSPPDSSSLYSRDDLLNIVALTMSVLPKKLSTRQIAAFLDVDCNLVEQVVKFGAEKWMFTVNKYDKVGIAISSLFDLLPQADRSGSFFISDRRLDPFFVKILCRQPPFYPLHAEASSHEIILRFLAAILAFEQSLSIQGIASVIGVDQAFVEGVVTVGPTKLLFALEGLEVKVPSIFLEGFLQDATRSGSFFVPQSSIDALFLHILSNGTTSLCSVHPRPQELLMDVLFVMMIVGRPGSTIRCVAAFLDVDAALVDAVLYGAIKQFFRFKDGRIYLSIKTKSLGSFLQDVDRAGDFCITNARVDDLYNRFLSRQLPPDPPYSHAQHILKSVLSVVAHSHKWTTISLLSAFLDVDPTAVERVVNGPSRLLFSPRQFFGKDVISLPPSLRDFLKDDKRSGRFFISNNNLDPFFLRILSSPLPPAGSHSRPQDVLRDMLTLILVTQEGSRTVSEIAVALDENASAVDSVVRARLPRLLFDIEWRMDRLGFSTTSLADFLRDAERSGEFCITDAMIDALFIRILSLPPPPHLATPPSKGDILRVMAVILASSEPLTVLKIAAHLGVDYSLVEGVVEIMPTKMLFTMDEETHKLRFSGPFLKPFLRDPNQSGRFFIPPTTALDDIRKLWPQHPSNSPEVPGDETGHVDGDADQEMKDQESAKGESAGQSETAAAVDTPYQSPLAIQTLPASAPPKRKFSRLASRQGSRNSANEVAASPSTPVRTKRPKTRGSLILDSDDEGGMIIEGAVVGDEDIWEAEAVGDDDVSMVEGER